MTDTKTIFKVLGTELGRGVVTLATFLEAQAADRFMREYNGKAEFICVEEETA